MTNGNQLYFVYSPKSTGEVEDTGLGAPEHKKTIEKKSDDKYTLSLDVTGAVGKTKPIDVLLIVDCSGTLSFHFAQAITLRPPRWNSAGIPPVSAAWPASLSARSAVLRPSGAQAAFLYYKELPPPAASESSGFWSRPGEMLFRQTGPPSASEVAECFRTGPAALHNNGTFCLVSHRSPVYRYRR